MVFFKWLLFSTVGLLFQAVVYLLYPVAYLAWSLFVYKPIFYKDIPDHQFNLAPGTGTQTMHNGALLVNNDNHGALSQYGFVQREGLELLQKDGSLIRKLNPDGSIVTGKQIGRAHV